MTITTLGDKFQMVIPKQVREALGLKARDKLVVWLHDDRIEVKPLRKYKDPMKVFTSICKKPLRITLDEMEELAESRH